jgi:hypothetical protein
MYIAAPAAIKPKVQCTEQLEGVSVTERFPLVHWRCAAVLTTTPQLGAGQVHFRETVNNGQTVAAAVAA